MKDRYYEHNTDTLKPSCKVSERKAIVALALGILVLLLWRRPGQLLYPSIWDEDGVILDAFLQHGWKSIFEPVSGYYIVSSKLINFLAYKISFFYYPNVAAFLALAFQLFVLLAIACSPTMLKHPYWCALGVVLLKTDPECFSIALYSFWWAGLLLILATFWKEDGKYFAVRIFFLLLGGFSSPMILVAMPVLIFRMLVENNHRSNIVAAISVIAFYVQMHSLQQNSGFRQGISWSMETFRSDLKTYVGSFFWKGFGENASVFVTVCVLILLVICTFSFLEGSFLLLMRKNKAQIIFLMWFFGSFISSALRGGGGAPRYLFYPYILLQWLLIFIIGSTEKKPIQLILLLSMFTFLIDGSLPIMTRDHNHSTEWQKTIGRAIRTETDVPLDLVYDGSEVIWRTNISGDQVKPLIEQSLLFNNADRCIYNSKRSTEELRVQLMQMESEECELSYSIDEIAGIVPGNGEVQLEFYKLAPPENVVMGDINPFCISGWVADTERGAVPLDIWVELNGTIFEARVIDRGDVAEYFANENLVHCGYTVQLPIGCAKEGENQGALIAITEEGMRYWRKEFTFQAVAAE